MRPQLKRKLLSPDTLQGVIIDGTFNTGTGEITPGSTKGNVKVDAVLGTASSIILPPVAAGKCRQNGSNW